jgi:hypothetical protein
VNAVGAFIADIDPIAGIKKLSDTEPTSTGLPEASANATVKFCGPFRSTPSAFEMVTVRLFPAGPLLMGFPELVELLPAPHAIARIENIAIDKIVTVFNIVSP